MTKRGTVGIFFIAFACDACASDSVSGTTTLDAGGPAAGGSVATGGKGVANGGASGSGNGGTSATGGSAGPSSGGSSNGGSGAATSNGGSPSGGSSGSSAGRSGAAGTAQGGASGSAALDGGSTNLVAELSALTRSCNDVVSTHQYALDSGAMTDICALTGAIFFTADMDIDCDGKTTAECNAQTDCCYQADTAFHNSKDEPLTASVTPYVVIPQDFKYSGLAGGNVTAVIYAGKLEWAVFGDTGPTDIIGEASYACAKDLGIDPNPKTGGTGGPVTYITFVGPGAAPADIENRAETQSLGETLAAALIRNN